MLRGLKSRLKPLVAACRRFARTRSITSTRDAIRLMTSLRHEMEPVQIDCRPLGRKVWLRPGTSDLEVFHGIFADKDYEFACWDISPELIMDAGANIGLTSLYFAKKHPAARIIAIEPEASNVELLRRNTHSEPNIKVISGALWPRKTKLSMVDGDAEKWAFSVREGTTSSGIEAWTIPDILADTGAGRIDLLKIDIEGAEKELFTIRLGGVAAAGQTHRHRTARPPGAGLQHGVLPCRPEPGVPPNVGWRQPCGRFRNRRRRPGGLIVARRRGVSSPGSTNRCSPPGRTSRDAIHWHHRHADWRRRRIHS